MACQRTMAVVAHACAKKGADLVCCIEDLSGAAPTKQIADQQFSDLQQVLADLGIEEAAHKASPPSTVMDWLGLRFDSVIVNDHHPA